MTNNPDKYGCDNCGNQVKWTAENKYTGYRYYCQSCADNEPDFVKIDGTRWIYKEHNVPEKFQPSSHGALKALYKCQTPTN